MKIINPATEQVISEVEVDGPEVIQSVWEVLSQGQRRWAKEPIGKRLAYIQNFYEQLETEQEELALTLTSEVGKPITQSRGEISGARSRIAWFLENAEKWLADEWIIKAPGNGR